MRFDIHPPTGNTRGPVYTESILRSLHSKQGIVSLVLQSGQQGVGLAVETDTNNGTMLAELQDAYPGTDIKPVTESTSGERIAYSANLRLRPDVLFIVHPLP